ncbi:MAG: hypothetical protein AUI36_16830, partial [Cyanobacteria bacterium 13_1_40CM_2_61_4]
RATSDAARHVADQIETGRRHLQNSVSFGLREKSALNELCAVAEECKVPNWDGHGSIPVSQETYRLAYQFLESLPLGIPAPSVGAEPDGHLTLEWHRSLRRTLSVSIGPEGDAHYAALLGLRRKAYGTEPFFDEVPKVIVDLIAQVMAA